MSDQQTITDLVTESWAEWGHANGIVRANREDLDHFLADARARIEDYMGWTS